MAESILICRHNKNGTGYCEHLSGYCVEGPCTAEELIEYAPVRHAKWEAWMPDKNGETREFICTECRFMVEMNWKQKECDYEWCPYCGCKMDKEE